MLDQRTAPYGVLLLRVSLGVLFWAHLYWKFFVLPGGLMQWWGNFATTGYPWCAPWSAKTVIRARERLGNKSPATLVAGPSRAGPKDRPRQEQR
jgi:hypothetical protein